MSETPPPQEQNRQPGSQQEMRPEPQASMEHYRGSQKLAEKVALISGGDSGIGRAVAVGFAKEGADVAITYLDEHEDAQETMRLIVATDQRTLAIAGDIGNPDFARGAAGGARLRTHRRAGEQRSRTARVRTSRGPAG
jgi:hypothetical protein